MNALLCPAEDEIKTQVIRAQYEGYLFEKDVLPTSQTETFVALKLYLKN